MKQMTVEDLKNVCTYISKCVVRIYGKEVLYKGYLKDIDNKYLNYEVDYLTPIDSELYIDVKEGK